MVRVRYMHRMTSRDMMRLTPRSIMQLVGRLHFHLSFIVDNRHCCHRRHHLRAQTALNYHHLRRRHLRAQTALLGTTCMLVQGDLNLLPSGWSVPPLPLHLIHYLFLFICTYTFVVCAKPHFSSFPPLAMPHHDNNCSLKLTTSSSKRWK